MAPRAIEYAPVKQLKSSGNIRDWVVPEKLAALKLSVQANGILVPLLGHYEGTDRFVDDGNHRLEAATSLGLETVPIILADHAPTPAELLTLQLVANSLRFNLKPMEKARAIERLMLESGWSAAQVSAKLGEQSESMISKLLTLLVHPKDVQDLIDAGRIPMSSAYAIATVPDAAERERLIREVLDGRLTRDKLVAVVKARKGSVGRMQPRKRARPRRSRVVISLGDGCSVAARPNVTVEVFVFWLQDLLRRLSAMEPQSELEDAVKALANPQS